MRIKRSVALSFRILVFPAVSFVCAAYFTGYAVWGSRGVLALEDARAQLGINQERLSRLQDEGRALRHRVSLMEQPDPDTDLVEEMARGVLLDGKPSQVAMSRKLDQERR